MRSRPSFAALLCAALLLAREPATSGDVHSPFVRLDGISQTSITGVCLDASGRLWVSTHDGLNRFDGYVLTVYRHDPEDRHSLVGNWVTAIGTTPRGRIWAIHGIGSASLFDPDLGRFLVLGPGIDSHPSIAGTMATAVAESPDGSLWVGTSDEGIARVSLETGGSAAGSFRIEQFRSFGGVAAPGPVVDLRMLDRDTLLAATRAGFILVPLARPDTGILLPGVPGSPVSLHPGAPGELWLITTSSIALYANGLRSRPLSLLSTPVFAEWVKPGVLWVVGKGGSLYEVGPGGLRQVLLPGLHGRIRRLARSQRGRMLLAAGNSLLSIDPVTRESAILPLPVRDPSTPITAIAEDSSGTLWLGTSGAGLWSYSPFRHRFSSYSVPHPPGQMTGSGVAALAPVDGSPSRVWVAPAPGGLAIFDVRTRSFVTGAIPPGVSRGLGANSVTSMRSSAGALWIGTREQGVVRISGGTSRWTSLLPRGAKARMQPPVTALLAEAPGGLWAGTGGAGLKWIDVRTGSVVQHHLGGESPPGRAAPSIWSMHRDKTGRYWFGLAVGGLTAARLDDSRRFVQLENYRGRPAEPCSLNSRTVTAIHESRDGTLWFGTYSGGLNQYRDGCFDHVTVADGLPGNLINSILEDGRGRLWLGTNAGIARYDPATGSVRAYEVSDGLQADEFVRGAALRLPDGTMIFGGVSGFNVFHPDSIPENTRPPRVLITGIRVLNAPRAPERSESGLPTIDLQYDENDLSFEYVAVDFANPSRHRYAYMLMEYDARWVDAGTRRFVSYTNLNPGSYLFRVRASNGDGIWNNDGASVLVRIAPPFWRTLWFVSLCAILTGLAAWGAAALVIRRKLQQRLALERVRADESERVRSQTARDFHDEMGHYLTRISMLTELVQRDVPPAADTAELRGRLATIAADARGLYQGTRDFLWALDPHHDSLLDVALRLKDFGEELLDGSSIAFDTSWVESDLERVRLSMDVRRELQMIFKEALHNSLKHSDARTVLLSASVWRTGYAMMLRDDGRGFSLLETQGGSGVRNMRARAARIKGALEINSGADGTSVRFEAETPAGEAGPPGSQNPERERFR